MRRLVLPAAAIIALLTAACSTPTDGSDPLDPSKSGERTVLPVTRLRSDPWSFAFYSGLTDSTRTMVRDTRGWQQTWNAIWRGSSPVPALPQIDFDREMVVVAALGTRPTGGYAIFVDSAYQYSSHIEVVVRKESPGRSCGTTQALTQPVDLARIPASSLSVRFRERSRVRECE